LSKTTGFSGGLTYEYLHSKYFSFGTDIIYNQRGFKTDINLLDNYIPTGEKEISKYNYDYISFPIKTGFNIGHKFYGFGYIGIIPSLLVKANVMKNKFNVAGGVIRSEIIDLKHSASKFDMAELFEIGGGYKIKGKYWLFTSFSYQQSFTTSTNPEI